MQVLETDYRFAGAMEIPDYASPQGGPWVERIVKTGGSPTVVAAAGLMALALDATNEAQEACLYQLDRLAFDIDDLMSVDFWAKVSGTIASATSIVFGLASAYNAALDSVAAHAWFKLAGSNTVVVETDDGTNDNDDKATGQILSTTVKRFTIDFAAGIKTVCPPPSSGAKGNVLFSAADGNGLLKPVARLLRFDMSNYSSGLQPYASIQKTASTNTGTLSIERIRIRHRSPS